MRSFSPGTLMKCLIEFLIRTSIFISSMILVVGNEIAEGSCQLEILLYNVLQFFNKQSAFGTQNAQPLRHCFDKLTQ